MPFASTIKSTTPYKISETPQIFRIDTSTLFEFDKFEDFEYSLYYNETTQNFVLVFVKPSGDVDSGCLRVVKKNQTGDFTICETCESSSSATIYCNIANHGNGTYIAGFYATGSLKWIANLAQYVNATGLIWDTLGIPNATILAIIFSGIVMSFFLVSPALGVVGLILGMLGSYALGFQPVHYMQFMGIVIVGGFIIWLIKR